MKQFRATLFGRPRLCYGTEPIAGCERLKVRELFYFLLLNRDQPFTRETLASLLWGDTCTTTLSKKYLRNTLWRMHKAVDRHAALRDRGLLVISSDWIELRSSPVLWLDVAVFERAYSLVMGIPEEELDRANVETVKRATALHTGSLLSNWQQDWCILERRRLDRMYLMMLEKVAAYHEARGDLEIALFFAERILRCDRAHESAHKRIMRLLHGMGDRTSALRQYERCVEALREEFDAEPESATVRLYEEIRTSTAARGLRVRSDVTAT